MWERTHFPTILYFLKIIWSVNKSFYYISVEILKVKFSIDGCRLKIQRIFTLYFWRFDWFCIVETATSNILTGFALLRLLQRYLYWSDYLILIYKVDYTLIILSKLYLSFSCGIVQKNMKLLRKILPLIISLNFICDISPKLVMIILFKLSFYYIKSRNYRKRIYVKMTYLGLVLKLNHSFFCSLGWFGTGGKLSASYVIHVTWLMKIFYCPTFSSIILYVVILWNSNN